MKFISIFEGHYLHDFQPIGLLFDRYPGWSCETCGIWSECSRKEFKQLFGIDYYEVINQDQYREQYVPKRKIIRPPEYRLRGNRRRRRH